MAGIMPGNYFSSAFNVSPMCSLPMQVVRQRVYLSSRAVCPASPPTWSFGIQLLLFIAMYLYFYVKQHVHAALLLLFLFPAFHTSVPCRRLIVSAWPFRDLAQLVLSTTVHATARSLSAKRSSEKYRDIMRSTTSHYIPRPSIQLRVGGSTWLGRIGNIALMFMLSTLFLLSSHLQPGGTQFHWIQVWSSELKEIRMNDIAIRFWPCEANSTNSVWSAPAHWSHDLNRWWKTTILRQDPCKMTKPTTTQQERRVGICLNVERHHLRCAQGDVVGIIGKNGAGKSGLVETSVACHLPYHLSHLCPWPLPSLKSVPVSIRSWPPVWTSTWFLAQNGHDSPRNLPQVGRDSRLLPVWNAM